MKKILLLIFTALFTLPALAIDLNKHPEVRAYIEKTSAQYHFNPKELEAWFTAVQFNQSIIDSMNKPGESKPWMDYRKIFIKPERIAQGENYWKEHMSSLNAATQKYGVPQEIIVGIIGVETGYGINKGKSDVFEALATIAFNYPSRSKYFTSELTQFLLLCREQGWDPLSIKGSYAGAMGLPQFMPSSYRTYAVDGSKSGKVDLFNDHQDVIASIANYMKEKGWHEGEPVLVPAKLLHQPQNLKEEQMDAKAKFTLEELKKEGLIPVGKAPTDLKVGVLAFEGEHGMQYWITFHNFDVIKRYNTNNKYALVVDQLGEAVYATLKGK